MRPDRRASRQSPSCSAGVPIGVLRNCLSCACLGPRGGDDQDMSSSAAEPSLRRRAESSSGRTESGQRQEDLGLFECNICYDLGACSQRASTDIDSYWIQDSAEAVRFRSISRTPQY